MRDRPKIGVIGIVSDALKADYFGTLQRLAEIGYQGIENSFHDLAELKYSPEEYRSRMSDVGMSLITVHALKGDCLKEGEALLERTASWGAERLCMAWGPAENSDQIKRDAAYYNQLGQACKGYGLELTYHNHDHEFARIERSDLRYYDLLMRETEANLVKLHFDAAWSCFGGMNTVVLASALKDRISVFHLKDLLGLEPGCEDAKGDREQARFTEVGEGIVPNRDIARLAVEAKTPWLVVEQDRLGSRSPWDSVSISFDNVMEMLP